MRSSRGMLGGLILCLAAVAVVLLALPALGIGTTGGILLLALVLLCPISMFFMMRGHDGRGDGERLERRSEGARQGRPEGLPRSSSEERLS